MSAPRRRTAIAWPDPTPQAQPNFPPPPAPAPQAVHAAPVVVPPLPDEPVAAAPQAPAPAPAPATAPAAPQAPASPAVTAPAAPVAMPRFVAPPAAAPAPAPAAEPSAPISLAGAEVPAVLMPASRFVAPQAPAAPLPPAQAAPQAPVAPLPPVAPQAQVAPVAPAPPAAPQPAPAAPAPAGQGSTAPPGFAGSRIIAAESAQLLALDPTFDDDEPFADLPTASASAATPAPAPQPSAAEFQMMAATTATATPMPRPAAPPREIAGSRLLGMLADLLPRRTEAPGLQPAAELAAQPSAPTAAATEAGTRSTAATAIRIAASVLLTAIALFVVGPALAGPLKGVPVLGAALDQLRAFTLYPEVYGLTWLTAVFAIASCFGIVVAHMEQQAHKQGMRRDPVRRLNIALGGLLALTFGSGLFTTVSSHGWAAGAAATGFFAALCLLVPLGRLPGAQAMASQPERAWVLLFLLSIPALLVAPSIPTILLLLLAFTRVRTNWGSIAAGADEHAGGPVDGTNRLSALVITLGVLIAASLGMHAMQQTSAEVNELRQGDEVTRIPGTIPGPTIDELKR